MIARFKDWVRTQPLLFDWCRAASRRWLKRPDPAYDFFDTFSRARGGKVSFIQIGANDGLRNDPIREFIVRDRWTGVLVEPLPSVFPLLQQNYARQPAGQLQFVNAAISANADTSLSFWTFKETFLGRCSLEERLEYLRKASFDKEHAKKFLRPGVAEHEALEEIQVPCFSINDLVRKRFADGCFDLLVIDAEGHEFAIITHMDFSRIAPHAIFFESHHLGPQRQGIFSFLAAHGYSLRDIGGDSVAIAAA